MVQLIQHFGSKDHSQVNKRRQWFIKARHEKRLQEESTDKLNDGILVTAAEAVMATQIQIETFRAKLDTYDMATTTALMENQATLEDIERRLIEIEQRLEGIWIHANVMEDGRRVFLNADRTQAYDELGSEIGSGDYDYALFPEDHFAIDPYVDQLKLRGELHGMREETLEARERIHEFDALQVEAREKVANGEISEADLEKLDADLLDAMPPEVGQHLDGYQPPSPVPDMTAAFATKAMPAISPSTTGVQAVYKPEM